MSVKWFFYIHAPVPLISIFRDVLDVGYVWYSYPFVIALYLVGQTIGQKIARYRLQKLKQSYKENA